MDAWAAYCEPKTCNVVQIGKRKKPMSGPCGNLIEPFSAPDVYCTELARAERVGPCVRLVFSVPQSSFYGDSTRAEQAVVAKLDYSSYWRYNLSRNC